MKRAHRAAHRRMWTWLLIAIPAILAVALGMRQDVDREIAPERLSPPAGETE